MRLVLATSKFVVDGEPFEGFPLLVAKGGRTVEVAHEFLWDILVEAGGARNVLTWEAYGRWMFDYFNYLEVNGLSWDQMPVGPELSVLAKYRNWSRKADPDTGKSRHSPGTTNQRLALLVRFYEYCKDLGYIDHLPYKYRATNARHDYGFLGHVKSGEPCFKPTVMVREHSPIPKLLTSEQAKVCFGTKFDASHRILFNLMILTGLRSCEARSFPLKYVFNPKMQRGLREGEVIRLKLDPNDMHIKNDKPRTIDMPWSLMAQLWSYSLGQREKRRKRFGGSPSELALTSVGNGYSKGALASAMRCVEKKVGFHVGAHMLRHTYGTFALATARKIEDLGEDPLQYVMDRMGHSSVATTQIYLHSINQLSHEATMAFEDEMNKLFGIERTTQKEGI